MSPEQTLALEARRRPRQIAIAGAAGALLMLAAVLTLVGPRTTVNEATLALIYQHRRETLSLLAAVINAVADVAVAGTLLYLWRCATARSERSPAPYVPVLLLVATVVSVVGGIAYAVEIASKASDFVSSGAQTYDEANRLTAGSLLLILQILSQLGSLLFAVSFVIVSLTAMRVGLLPRFLAYVGIFAGILTIIPLLGGIPIVQLYWLVAVAILLSGNWPSGLPPAWRSGRAEPWPSSAEMRAQRVADAQAAREQRASRKRGGRGGRGADGQGPAAAATRESPTGESSGEDSAHGASSTRSSSPKRKRKRRR